MSALWDLGLHSRNILLFSTPNTLLSSTLSPKPSMSSAQCKAHADRLMRRKWHEEETVCMCLHEIFKVPWCWRSEHWERGSPFLMSCRLVRLWKNDSETEWKWWKQTAMRTCGKLSTLHDPVACSTTFSSNNYFSVGLHQSVTSLWMNEQHCCSSFRFVGIHLGPALLRSCHSISIRLRDGLRLNHCNAFLFSFSPILLQICFYAWIHWPVGWSCLGQALAIGQMTSRLTLEYLSTQRSSWGTQWLQAA